jgi:hypothetical protein
MMKIPLSSRALFVMGFAVLIASNIIVLAGVALNRAGEPEAVTVLTERELCMPYRFHKENSGLALRLVWRTEAKVNEAIHYIRTGSFPAWFDEKKLEELGFEVEAEAGPEPYPVRYREQLQKEVFIVLENDGNTFERALGSAEAALEKARKALKTNPQDKKLKGQLDNAMGRLKLERTTESRLFAVDAGIDARTLRERYGDRPRFIIAKGIVKPGYAYGKKKGFPSGHISKLSMERVNVPLELRKEFDAIPAARKPKTGSSGGLSYRVEVAYGSRFEPWIRAVHHGKK